MMDNRSRVRFCRDCKSLLHPRERANKLWYACRKCGLEEPAPSNCIYRREVSVKNDPEIGNVKHLVSDPTLPRATMICPKCQTDETVYHQLRSTSKDAKMTLVYICRNLSCLNRWAEY